MSRRENKHAHEHVRGLMAELGELAEDLGLVEPGKNGAPARETAADPPAAAAPPQRRPDGPELAAPPPPSAPVWRSGPEVTTGAAASALPSRGPAPLPPPAEPEVEPPADQPPSLPAGSPALWTLPRTPPPTPGANIAMLTRETPEGAPLPRETPERAPLALVPDVLPSADPEPEDAAGAIPLWESATLQEQAAPRVTLWDAFSPELAVDPPRPWSPAAAMAVLEPAAPPGGVTTTRPGPERLWDRRPHAFTVVTAIAVVVAVAVFTFSRLDLGRTAGPGEPVTHAALVVDHLRTVAATTPSQVRNARTTNRFPASASAIDLEVTYHDMQPGDTLQIVIILQPAHSGQPAVTVSDQTHGNLDSAGDELITVDAPPGGFTPGSYEVRAIHDGTLEQSTTFQVI